LVGEGSLLLHCKSLRFGQALHQTEGGPIQEFTGFESDET